MDKASALIWGPPDDIKFETNSLAELVYDCLRKREQSDIVLVEPNIGKEVTRGELLQTATKLTCLLEEFGISKDDTVGLITTNTWKLLIPSLATTFLGATTTCINPASSKDELHHYLNLSKPKILFISTIVLDKIRDLKKELSFIKHVVILDAEKTQNGETAFEELLNREVNTDNFRLYENEDALIFYSSGTTGFPKGVILTQKNIISFTKYFQHPDHMGINDRTVLLGILPSFHIFGYLLLYACLLYGKRIIISKKFEPDNFLKLIQNHKATYLATVPPLLLFLAKSPLVDQYDVSSLTHVFCGAAPLGKELEHIDSQRLKVPVRQLYGMTECAGISMMPPNVCKPGSVGKIVIGHHAKVVDPDSGITLGPGKSGEICFKGPSVMKGYKNNEVETERTIDQDGYLHTGDIGYFDEDEFLFIIDRKKEIMKYKGFQVPPALLEDILQRHPGIKDAAVIGKPDEKSGELPTAIIVKQPNVQLTEEEIIEYVAKKVSVEKRLHGGVIFMQEIPRTASGKVIKRDLKKIVDC